MSMIVPFILFFFLFILLWFLLENRKRLNSPPGPFRFPLLGTLPQIALANPISYLALDKLSKQYGDLMSVKMGFVDAVVVASYEAMRDLCGREETLGRQCEGIWWDRNLKQNIGLGFSNGEPWQAMRKFSRDSLRDYGFGSRETMEYMVMDELVELIKRMDEDRQQNTQGLIKFTVNYFHMSVGNVICSMVSGKRFEYDDPELHDFLKHGHNFIKNGVFGAGILTAFPFLKSVVPETLGYNTQIQAAYGIQACAKRLLDRRRKEEYKTNPRCYTDDFLIKIDEDANKPNPIFTEDNFKVVFGDIMQGGSDTCGNSINFTLLLLVVHQSVQDKLYKEIVNVCGIDRYPTLEQRASMPYAQAVILEGFRWSRTLVHGLPKKITQDFVYRGYTFRKDCVLMMNVHSIFFDKKFWKDPKAFRPERFLDDNGDIIPNKAERIIAFGMGKRNCFGEILARDSSFLFIMTMIQTFEFKLPPGANPSLEPMMGITLGPYEYEALVSLRNSQ